MDIIMTSILSYNYSWSDYAFFLLNLGIIAAYLCLAIVFLFSRVLLPKLNVFLSKSTRLSVAAFYVIASITRADLAWNAVNKGGIECPNATVHAHKVVCVFDVDNSFLTLHGIQVVAAWIMVVLFIRDILYRFKVVGDKNDR